MQVFFLRKIYCIFAARFKENIVRGAAAPFFVAMISEQKVIALVEEKIAETGTYLVEVKVSTTNQIRVYIDNPAGISIQQCVQVSRHIEGNLDREVEDYELEVSSPGLTQPFKVRQQYEKNVGRDVTVVTNEGVKHTGKLLEADAEGFKVMEKAKKKEEPKQVNFKYDEVKETKVVISFK